MVRLTPIARPTEPAPSSPRAERESSPQAGSAAQHLAVDEIVRMEREFSAKLTELDDAEKYLRMGTAFAQSSVKAEGLSEAAVADRATLLKRAALKHWKLAADSGHPVALHKFGLSALMGRGQKADEAAGLAMMTKSAAQGYPGALTDLGRWKLNRPKVAEDIAEGIEMIKSGHRGGDARASMELAEIFASGKFGVPPDGIRTLDFLHAAAAASGSVGTKAKLALGERYATGENVEFSVHMARHWLSDLAANGNEAATALLRKAEERQDVESEMFVEQIRTMLA